MSSALMKCASLVSRISSLSAVGTRGLSTTPFLEQVIKLSRMRVVDNSALGKAAVISGKPARVIHVYTKKGYGTIGDKVLLAIKGQKKRGYIVGVKQSQRAMIPKMDTNNVVLIEDNGSPIGNRITVPIPSMLRKRSGDFTKILSLATRFV